MTTQLNEALAGNPAWTVPEALQQFLDDGEKEFVEELIEVFKSQTCERLGLLRAAIENERWEEARAQAHAIKGGSRQVGADQLAAACLGIEMESGQNPAAAAALLSQAETSFEEACRVMTVP